MKSCIIFLTLLLIFSINKASKEEYSIKLLFKNGVAETTISIKKNTTYYGYFEGVTNGKNYEFELMVENASTSPLIYFELVEVIESLDVSRFTHKIDLSEKQESNNLVLSGNYEIHSFFSHHDYIAFRSSCDIPNFQIKITVSEKSTEKSTDKSTESFILTIVICIVIIIVIGICICIVSIFVSKRNQKIQPTYAPIQPPI
jgi:hypothetical protein